MPAARGPDARRRAGQKRYGLEFADQPVLAFDRVRYFGEPVAVVAAEHPEQARRAAAAIRVDYEPLEPVVDAERAAEQAPIHDERWTTGHGYRVDERPNVVRSMVIRHGDPDVQGDVSVSGVYELGIQDQAFLGPEPAWQYPKGPGRRHIRRHAVAQRRARPVGSASPPKRGRNNLAARRRVRRPRDLSSRPQRDARDAHTRPVKMAKTRGALSAIATATRAIGPTRRTRRASSSASMRIIPTAAPRSSSTAVKSKAARSLRQHASRTR